MSPASGTDMACLPGTSPEVPGFPVGFAPGQQLPSKSPFLGDVVVFLAKGS